MWQPFEPHPLILGGWLQTVIGNTLAKPVKLPQADIIKVTLPDGDSLRLCVDAPRSSESSATDTAPIIILMHGLGGNSESAYQLRIAHHLTSAGYRVVRFNHRGAAPGGAGEAKGVYHSGRTADLFAAIAAVHQRWPQAPFGTVGFSLSANMLLALLGKDPTISRRYPLFRAALAVCPPIDLQESSKALSRWRNRAIDKYYVRRLKELVREKVALFPDSHNPKFGRKILLRDFDEVYTSQVAGFRNREEYYQKCSSKPVLHNIPVETDILVTSDDPLIPLSSFADVKTNSITRLHFLRGGGHMGMISRRKTPLGDYRWMDAAVVGWAKARFPL